MEIKQYLLLVQKWLWLGVVGLVVGIVAGVVVSLVLTPAYDVTTKILVSRNRQESNVDFAYLSDQQLLQTYIELLKTRPVLESASEKVGIELDPKMITVAQVRDTQVMELTVEYHDPEKAVLIANTLIDVLIEQNEKLQADRFAADESSLKLQTDQVQKQMDTLRVEFDQVTNKEIQDQLTQVEEQIKTIQDQITALQRDSTGLTAEKQAQLSQLETLLQSYQKIRSNLIFLGTPSEGGSPRENSRMLQLQSTLNLYQQLYLNLLNNLESLRLLRLQYAPSIVQIEAATLPEGPVRPRPLLYTLLAGVVGAVLGIGAGLLIEFFDDTLKSPKDIERVLGLPTLGSIPEYPRRDKGENGAFIAQYPKSPVSEAFRLLRANLAIAGGENSLKTLLVLSPGAQNGKTVVALNLAASLSLLGKRVTLVDANVRSPHLHISLGLDNAVGLGDALSTETDVTKVSRPVGEFKTISAVTGGSALDSPTEVLESDRLSAVLSKLSAKADMVILDGPALFVADALAFASRVDGVLMVIRPGHTRAVEARAAIDYLQRAGTRVVGVVLNYIPRNWTKYYEGYYLPSEYATEKPK